MTSLLGEISAVRMCHKVKENHKEMDNSYKIPDVSRKNKLGLSFARLRSAQKLATQKWGWASTFLNCNYHKISCHNPNDNTTQHNLNTAVVLDMKITVHTTLPPTNPPPQKLNISLYEPQINIS